MSRFEFELSRRGLGAAAWRHAPLGGAVPLKREGKVFYFSRYRPAQPGSQRHTPASVSQDPPSEQSQSDSQRQACSFPEVEPRSCVTSSTDPSPSIRAITTGVFIFCLKLCRAWAQGICFFFLLFAFFCLRTFYPAMPGNDDAAVGHDADRLPDELWIAILAWIPLHSPDFRAAAATCRRSFRQTNAVLT